MRKPIYLLLLSVAAVLGGTSYAELPNLDEALEKMIKRGKSVQDGRSESQGVYIVAIAEVEASSSPEESCVEAMLRAKKSIAAFLGQKVSAKQEVQTTAGNGDPDESFTDQITAETSQMLRGLRLLNTITKGGKTYLVFYTSEYAANETAALQAAMRQEGGVNIVKALGMASLDGRRPETVRNQALNNAKMSAVEQVLGAVITSMAQQMDDRALIKTFSGASGFVKTYRILQEGAVEENLYQIVIVAEVAKDELQRSYETYLKQMGDVKFFIDAPPGTLLDLLTEKFVDWGFPIVEVPESASYFIVAKEKIDAVVHPADGSDGTRATVTVSIVDALTQKELLALNNDPRKSVSFIGDSVRREQLAITQAVKQMDTPLHEKINRLVGKMVNQGRTIQIILEEYSPQMESALDEIVACVRAVPGCGEPILAVDIRLREATLSCDYQGAIETLRGFMMAEMRKRLPAAICPEEVGVSANQWRLSFDARASAASRR